MYMRRWKMVPAPTTTRRTTTTLSSPWSVVCDADKNRLAFFSCHRHRWRGGPSLRAQRRFHFFKKNVLITSILREYFNNFYSPVPSDTTFPNVLSACLLLSSLLLATTVLLEVEFLLLPSGGGGGGGGDFSFLFAFLRGTDFSGTWDPLKKS